MAGYPDYIVGAPSIGSRQYPADFSAKFNIIQGLLNDLNTVMTPHGDDTIDTYLDRLETAIATLQSSLTDSATDTLIDVDEALNNIISVLELMFDTETVAYKSQVMPADTIDTSPNDDLATVIADNPDTDIFLKWNKDTSTMQWSTSAGIKGGPYDTGDVTELSIPVFNDLGGTEVINTDVVITEDGELHGHGALIQQQAGSYTIDAAADSGKVITVLATATITLPSPAAATSKGFQATIINRGTGTVTVTCTDGASTIEAKLKTGNANPVLDGQYSAASVIWLDAGHWGVYGDLEYDIPTP